MAIYRQLQTSFWQDGFVGELTPEEKFFYLYLLTNPRSTQCGIFEINIRIMEAETGYNRETLEKLLKRFEEYGKVICSKETREIFILNWIKYNFINSKNTICCINKELKLVKNKEFVKMLYEDCLRKGYDVEVIFKDVTLAVMEDKIKVSPEETKVKIEESKTEDDKLGVQAVASDSTDEKVGSSDGIEKQGLTGGFEGAYKGLGEKEEEKEIQKEASIKEEVINKTKGAQEDSKKKEFSCKLLMEFNKNIRQATIRDLEKLGEWKVDFEDEVIIQAIYEAVKYKARHIGYIESVLGSWRSAHITTMDELKLYREGDAKKEHRCNSDAYRYLD